MAAAGGAGAVVDEPVRRLRAHVINFIEELLALIEAMVEVITRLEEYLAFRDREAPFTHASARGMRRVIDFMHMAYTQALGEIHAIVLSLGVISATPPLDLPVGFGGYDLTDLPRERARRVRRFITPGMGGAELHGIIIAACAQAVARRAAIAMEYFHNDHLYYRSAEVHLEALNILEALDTAVARAAAVVGRELEHIVRGDVLGMEPEDEE